jgi:hypothetical protein
VLAILPFTAPFACFDLCDFLGVVHSHDTTTTISAPASAAQDDNADDVAASDACVQRAHPIACGNLLPVTAPAGGDTILTVVRDTSTPFSPLAHNLSSLALTLRV